MEKINPPTKIKGKYAPPIITFKNAETLSGRHRNQLELAAKKGTLNYGFIESNPSVGERGYKVLVADEKWKEYLSQCKERDQKSGNK